MFNKFDQNIFRMMACVVFPIFTIYIANNTPVVELFLRHVSVYKYIISYMIIVSYINYTGTMDGYTT